ncbi:hypothetical protein DPMN_121005 [Dreissena polymorpha]|uniref:Uncharacterized protein n=1 Tax=Dreissena polymorpha TaxID=45954 RepID=A0A9D4GKW8_DREPO|nr:hypothetical protein DPMN_121005 [Dreissena polymorpha]
MRGRIFCSSLIRYYQSAGSSEWSNPTSPTATTLGLASKLLNLSKASVRNLLKLAACLG